MSIIDDMKRLDTMETSVAKLESRIKELEHENYLKEIRLVRLERWKKNNSRSHKKKVLFTPKDWCLHINNSSSEDKLMDFLIEQGIIEKIMRACLCIGYKTTLKEFEGNNIMIAGKYYARFPASFYEGLDYE